MHNKYVSLPMIFFHNADRGDGWKSVILKSRKDNHILPYSEVLLHVYEYKNKGQPATCKANSDNLQQCWVEILPTKDRFLQCGNNTYIFLQGVPNLFHHPLSEAHFLRSVCCVHCTALFNWFFLIFTPSVASRNFLCSCTTQQSLMLIKWQSHTFLFRLNFSNLCGMNICRL